jgi:hypothetical protein
MSVKVETNSPQLEAWLTEAANKQSEIVRAWKEEGENIVMEEMRGRTPIRTGFLRESITAAETPDGFIVYPTAKYAAFVEKGTGPHTIFPSTAKVLRFELPSGAVIFAKHVKHPGFSGRWFVRSTWEAVKLELQHLYLEIVERVLG